MNKKTGQFRYEVVYDDIRKGIEEGRFLPGSKLPIDEELGQRYGVSLITVKKALTMLKEEGRIQRIPGVGSIVADRILPKRASESGKKETDSPNQAAVSDAKGRNTQAQARKIGLILEHVSSSYGLDMFYHIDREAERRGFKLYPRFSYYRTEKETEEIEFLLQEGIEGLIIMPCHGVYYNPSLLKQILNGFPVVIVDKKLEGIPVPCVRTDNKLAFFELTQTLYQRGCRRFGYITNKVVGTSSLMARRNGFRKAVQELGITEYSECVIEQERVVFEQEAAPETVFRIGEYLDQYRDLDAVICAEYGTTKLIRAAAAGVSLPLDNITVACMDGLDNSRYLHMHQDEITMAQRAVTLIAERIEKRRDGEQGFREPDGEQEILIPAILTEGRKKP